jgi:hypothetical protein
MDLTPLLEINPCVQFNNYLLNFEQPKSYEYLYYYEFNFYLKIVLICIGIFKFFTVDYVYDFSPPESDLKEWTIINSPGFSE